MDYKFVITNEGAGYRVQLKNEFETTVSWNWNSNLYAAVLDTVSWQLKCSPGDTKDVIRAVLNTDFKEVETFLKMETLKKEFSDIGKQKKEVYLRP